MLRAIVSGQIATIISWKLPRALEKYSSDKFGFLQEYAAELDADGKVAAST